MKTKLILMRHGQSVWNQKNLFTGWVDIPLSNRGIEEAFEGGKKIAHLPIDLAFTSTLIRSHMTLCLSLLHHSSNKTPLFIHEKGSKQDEWSQIYSEKTRKEMIPVYLAWELNERMYGELQGLNKRETADKYGEKKVHEWRRSFAIAPPGGESLKMTAERTIPYFQENIIPLLDQGKSIFICAHGNSLRSIIMYLDQLNNDEVVNLELATGEPIVYGWNQGTWTKQG